jgi:hypothetical protein
MIAGAYCASNVIKHPASIWIVRQLREAFPFESAPRFLIFDRDEEYGLEVAAAVRSLRITPVRNSLESSWQNGLAERWVESCRRDLLDHVIAVNERHLKCLLSEYVRYGHEDRTHLGLGKGTSVERTRSIYVICRTRPRVATSRISASAERAWFNSWFVCEHSRHEAADFPPGCDYGEEHRPAVCSEATFLKLVTPPPLVHEREMLCQLDPGLRCPIRNHYE